MYSMKDGPTLSCVRMTDKKDIHWNLFLEHEVMNIQRGSLTPPFRIASSFKISLKKIEDLSFRF